MNLIKVLSSLAIIVTLIGCGDTESQPRDSESEKLKDSNISEFREAVSNIARDNAFNLGAMYFAGEGGGEDDALAVKWFTKAAEQGHVEAQFNLGSIYQVGEGVAEDDAEAIKWYTKAAKQGLAEAQFNLGFMYDVGEGVPEDDTLAVKWYSKAAEQGHGKAQYNLGWMYDKGEGVLEDSVLSYVWWNLAAAQGMEKAKAGKYLLIKKMTKADISKAQRLSREYHERITKE